MAVLSGAPTQDAFIGFSQMMEIWQWHTIHRKHLSDFLNHLLSLQKTQMPGIGYSDQIDFKRAANPGFITTVITIHRKIFISRTLMTYRPEW